MIYNNENIFEDFEKMYNDYKELKKLELSFFLKNLLIYGLVEILSKSKEEFLIENIKGVKKISKIVFKVLNENK